MKAAFIFVLVLILSSCSPTAQLAKLQGRHPARVAAACALYYPTKDSISIYTEIQPGRTIHIPGPVQFVDCDSAVRSAGPGQANAIPCPPASDTVFRVDTLLVRTFYQVESTAALDAATFQKETAREAQIKAESGRGAWRLIALLLAGYVLARMILKYYFKINLLP